MPLVTAAIIPETGFLPFVAGISLVSLMFLGGLAAHIGGASRMKGALRVTLWGALAMGLTAGAGALFGTVL